MKGWKDFVAGRGLKVLFLCAALAVGDAIPQSHAATYNIGNGNSLVNLNDTPSGGLYNWLVDGINQLAQQSYWYRIGALGGEQNIGALGAPTVTQAYGPGGRQLTAVYAGSGFGIQINYTLAGGALGSGNSGLTSQIRISNTTSNALAFHLFQYSDFDLGGTAGNQQVDLYSPGTGWNRAIQTLPSLGLTNTTLAVSAATYAEAAFSPITLGKLSDANPTSLAGSATSAGLGNVTYTLQWDYSIAPGTTQIISIIQNIQVPEPTSLALLGLAAVGWLAFRRRN